MPPLGPPPTPDSSTSPANALAFVVVAAGCVLAMLHRRRLLPPPLARSVASLQALINASDRFRLRERSARAAMEPARRCIRFLRGFAHSMLERLQESRLFARVARGVCCRAKVDGRGGSTAAAATVTRRSHAPVPETDDDMSDAESIFDDEDGAGGGMGGGGLLMRLKKGHRRAGRPRAGSVISVESSSIIGSRPTCLGEHPMPPSTVSLMKPAAQRPPPQTWYASTAERLWTAFQAPQQMVKAAATAEQGDSDVQQAHVGAEADHGEEQAPAPTMSTPLSLERLCLEMDGVEDEAEDRTIEPLGW